MQCPFSEETRQMRTANLSAAFKTEITTKAELSETDMFAGCHTGDMAWSMKDAI